MVRGARRRLLCPVVGSLTASLLAVASAPNSDAACRFQGVAVAPTPPSPTVYDHVRFTVSGSSVDHCVPEYDGVAVEEGRIEIHGSVPPGGCIQIPTPFSFETEELPLKGGTYAVGVVIAEDAADCSYPTSELVVTAGPAPVTGAAATLLYPYFEVDLADNEGSTTLIAVGNTSADPTVVHLTVWTDWGIPTYAFDVFVPGNGVQTYSMRQLFSGELPETGGAAGAALGCSTPVAVPPLAGEAAAELRRLHSGRPSATTGLCAGSGRRGPAVVTGFLTADVLDRCSGGGLVTPHDPGYFENVALAVPGPPLASNRNVLWGDLLFTDVGGDNVQGIAAVPIPADAERWSGSASIDFPGSFYRSLGAFGALDHRAPLAAVWKSRFLRGGAFSPQSRALLWLENTPDARLSLGPIPCGQRRSRVNMCQRTRVEIYDESGERTHEMVIEGVEEVTGLYLLGGETLPTDLPFGTLRSENFYIDGCFMISGDAFPLQAYLAVLTEAEGRLSFAFRGTPLR